MIHELWVKLKQPMNLLEFVYLFNLYFVSNISICFEKEINSWKKRKQKIFRFLEKISILTFSGKIWVWHEQKYSGATILSRRGIIFVVCPRDICVNCWFWGVTLRNFFGKKIWNFLRIKELSGPSWLFILICISDTISRLGTHFPFHFLFYLKKHLKLSS